MGQGWVLLALVAMAEMEGLSVPWELDPGYKALLALWALPGHPSGVPSLSYRTEGLPWAGSSEFCLMWSQAGWEGPLFICDGYKDTVGLWEEAQGSVKALGWERLFRANYPGLHPTQGLFSHSD